MLNKSTFIRKFISFAVNKTLLSPSLSSFSLQKGPLKFLRFSPIQYHHFSSFQSLNNNYKYDLVFLEGYSREQLTSAKEILDLYSTSQDLEIFGPEEIHWIITLLQDFSMTFHQQGNYHKAYSYIKEAEHILKELKIYDTFYAANTHYFKSLICLDLDDDPTTDILYHCDEVDRICMLLDDSPETRSLKVQNLQTRGYLHKRRNEYDKALEFFNQVIQRKDQVLDEVLPHLLFSAFQEMGSIYESQRDSARIIDCYGKGLEVAIAHHGENSTQAFFFYENLAQNLFNVGSSENALFDINKGLQVALNIYPSNHPEIAWCHYLLGSILADMDNPAEALEAYKKATKIFEMSPQKHLPVLSEIYFKAAIIHHKLKNSKEAEIFSVKSKKMLIKSNDPDIVEISVKRAREFSNNKMKEAVELYLMVALDVCQKSNIQDKQVVAEVNFVLGGHYFGKKEWSKAFKLLKESEKLFQECSVEPQTLFLLNSTQAPLHALFKDYEESVKYLLKIIEACQANGDLGYLQQAYQYLGKVYHKNGMTEKGKEANEKFRNLCKSNNQGDPKVQFGVIKAQQVFWPIETLGEQNGKIE